MKNILKLTALISIISNVIMINVLGAVNITDIDFIEDNYFMLREYDSVEKQDIPRINNSNRKDFIGYSLVAYRTEQEYKVGKKELYNSERFIKEGNSIKIMKEDMSDLDRNAWFMDTDGRWYAFDNNGELLSGIIYDKKRDTYYILDTSEDEFGALVHANGFYKVNGKILYLAFDNTHTGTFGAVEIGIDSIK